LKQPAAEAVCPFAAVIQQPEGCCSLLFSEESVSNGFQLRVSQFHNFTMAVWLWDRCHPAIEKDGLTGMLKGVSQVWGRIPLRDDFLEADESRADRLGRSGEKWHILRFSTEGECIQQLTEPVGAEFEASGGPIEGRGAGSS
jgi:hypothetical protein